jgi:hypothetical protein
MTMPRTILLTFAFALAACTRPLVSLDDEAGESGTSESSTSESSESESSESESSTSESSESEASTSTDTTSEEDSSTFIVPVDFNSEQCMCDPLAQDCPQGEKCVPYSSEGDTWDCVKCVPVLGDQAAGEACSSDGIVMGTDDCDASSWCFTSEGEGTCHAFCTGAVDNPECAPDSNCWMSNEGAIWVCVPACDPLLQDCEQGTGCYSSGVIFGCVFVPSASLSVGEPCQDLNDCAPGLQCTEAEALPSCAGEACCTSFCEIGLGDAACDLLPDTVCMPFFEQGMAPAGYEHVGVCILPP